MKSSAETLGTFSHALDNLSIAVNTDSDSVDDDFLNGCFIKTGVFQDLYKFAYVVHSAPVVLFNVV